MEDIRYRLKGEMDKLRKEFLHNFGKMPEVEKEFIDHNLAKLDETLRRRGDKHISDISNPAKLNILKPEGGDGYIIRILHSKWGKLTTAYTSLHPVP